MTTKAIAFLGYTPANRPYQRTTYFFGDQTCTTPFMAEATARFFQPDLLLVLVTKEAEEQNYPHLEAAVREVVQIQAVKIPSCRSEDELWQLFAAIEEHIDADDQIIFDITNGFRSLPVLAFLAASYVRIVRRAIVKRMIYGAYDASQDGKTPVFDLTPFLELQQWAIATDAFLKYGRADDLSALGSELHAFQPIAATLRSLTAALQTSRPAETMTEASELVQAVQQVQQPGANAQPFMLLLDRISAEYGALAYTAPDSQEVSDTVIHAREIIKRQLQIIGWYIDKGMFVQALTAAREWMVSLVLMYAGEDLFHKARRNAAEKLIRNEQVPPFASKVPNLETIREVWRQTTTARNSVAHHGWSMTALSAQEIEDTAREVCQHLPGLMVL